MGLDELAQALAGQSLFVSGGDIAEVSAETTASGQPLSSDGSSVLQSVDTGAPSGLITPSPLEPTAQDSTAPAPAGPSPTLLVPAGVSPTAPVLRSDDLRESASTVNDSASDVASTASAEASASFLHRQGFKAVRSRLDWLMAEADKLSH